MRGIGDYPINEGLLNDEAVAQIGRKPLNLSQPIRSPVRFLYVLWNRGRFLLPRQRCETLGSSRKKELAKIGKLYVINLDRQSDRWLMIERELKHVKGASGDDLTNLAERFSAIDAKNFEKSLSCPDVDPFYTLRDQLFVEPQPNTLPDRFELNRPINMSRPEIAIAQSHIEVWKKIASGEQSYCLVLEDDIWFRIGFCFHLDQAWEEIDVGSKDVAAFDILYLSYIEARHGAPKTFLSKNVFQPVRGLWHLSGYVLSRKGASKLLNLLPCRGPVDLWINQQFHRIDVRATRRSVISQRRDIGSNNSYSVLPALTKIGVIDSESASLFQARPLTGPVFVFGPENTGLSALAMALSMLGYRCCNDLRELPKSEHENLLLGSKNRIFNAYVNIGTLFPLILDLNKRYPSAKFIFTTEPESFGEMISLGFAENDNFDAVVLRKNETNKWRVICEHLKCTPPFSPYPEIFDFGQRELLPAKVDTHSSHGHTNRKHDASPWVIESLKEWQGIHCVSKSVRLLPRVNHTEFEDTFSKVSAKRWLLRDDTFAGNLALFRPYNIELRAGGGLALNVKVKSLGVRGYGAAAISSREQYLYGKFEAVIQASNVPGVVTGFFLHRDSPRQEIDIEIVGRRSNQLFVNVFYNPGDEGANFDYGYRGSPSSVELGFDASKSFHRYAIEWGSDTITWLVDGQPVHRRVNWYPTPIPYLPMTLHINTWPSRSRELAGRLRDRKLPSTSNVRSISVAAGSVRANVNIDAEVSEKSNEQLRLNYFVDG
jgi:GR25 family glycosyltransferase involved in LPS biosynthesis